VYGIPNKKYQNNGITVKLMLAVAKIKTPASLAEKAYEAIKEGLLQMDLTDPSVENRVDERRLAEQLGVSRTPLREAINRLVIEGFLTVVPRKGVYVVKKSKKEIVEILLVRAALEGLAARLATQYVTDKDIRQMKKIMRPFDSIKKIKGQSLKFSKANIEFHELILKLSRSQVLIDLASNLFDHIQWIRTQAAGFEERFKVAHHGHLAIIEALAKKDAALAEKKMRRHIEILAQHIEENVQFPA
jgi:DNA-binding GntR family transcriptional regulator